MKYCKHIIYISFLFIIISCKNEIKKEPTYSKINTLVKYSKGFDIQIINDYKKLIIKSPYKNSKEIFEYIITQKKYSKDKVVSTDKSLLEIEVPIDKMVVTSTTHIPMIELLEAERSLVGFPYMKYISSEKTRELIDQGNIKEVGNESSLNTEVLLELKPELIVGYAVSSINKEYTILRNSGIRVIFNGDWLEETPLGRAEWIKFFGLLYGKSKEANRIFNTIEADYESAKKIALTSNRQPTVLSGAIMSKDIWSLPAGESFVATFLKDANLNYLWKETTGKGSLSLSFESVFEKARDADFWIAPGYFSSKEQMLNSNKHYAEFKAFKNDHIYTPSTKKGKTGGIIYYELAPTRPDLVLKDIIKITNPELLPNYTLTFFEKMK